MRYGPHDSYEKGFRNLARIDLRGTVHWCKLLGEPRKNFNGDGREWVVDFTPDKDSLKEIKRLKLNDRLKDKDDERGEFLVLRVKEFRADGNPNKPVRIYTSDNRPWNVDTLIGNGSVVDVALNHISYGPGKRDGLYLQAVRVLELKEFKATPFKPLDEDDAYFRADNFKEDFGLETEEKPQDSDLDDEIAF